MNLLKRRIDMAGENIALILIVILSICVLLIIGYMVLITYDLYSNLDKTIKNKKEVIPSDYEDGANIR